MPIHSTRLEADVTFLPAFLHVDDGRGAGVGVPGGDAAGKAGMRSAKVLLTRVQARSRTHSGISTEWTTSLSDPSIKVISSLPLP
jgi:hypothetical protein